MAVEYAIAFEHPSSVRRLMVASLLALVMCASVVATPSRVSAQSNYGSSAYGTETYSADKVAADATDVTPPNTGFEVVARAARNEPLLFWGSVTALTAAGGLITRTLTKRKQEN